MNPPTLAGFQAFIANVMAIDENDLPPGSPVIAMAFNIALAIVNPLFQSVPIGCPPYSSIYNLMVYNLAGDNLINYAQDQDGRCYFSDLQKKYNIGGFVSGVIQSGNDEGTGQSMVVLEAAQTFTLANLQSLKTPWGRTYMGFAQSYGPYVWGIS